MYLKQWEAEATVFVNGQLLIGEVTLNHGDRVIFGGSHYFRLVPCCVSFGDFTSVSLIDNNINKINTQVYELLENCFYLHRIPKHFVFRVRNCFKSR